MSTETPSSDDSTDEQEPTNLHRDDRPRVHGHGPRVQRNADGSIQKIEIAIKSGALGNNKLTLTYYANEGVAHVEQMENGDHKEPTIGRRHFRMLALADDVVGRVPGVETVTRFEDEISKTRETYERDLDERCAQEGCYDMPDTALDSGRCREHTPREDR